MRSFLQLTTLTASLLVATWALPGCSSDGAAGGKMEGAMPAGGAMETGKMEGGAMETGKMGGAIDT
jgi:hypothetical protein